MTFWSNKNYSFRIYCCHCWSHTIGHRFCKNQKHVKWLSRSEPLLSWISETTCLTHSPDQTYKNESNTCKIDSKACNASESILSSEERNCRGRSIHWSTMTSAPLRQPRSIGSPAVCLGVGKKGLLLSTITSNELQTLWLLATLFALRSHKTTPLPDSPHPLMPGH